MVESTKSYVLGFGLQLASHGVSRVLLIEKQRPAWMRGRLNGIGGHIEPGETPIEAMRREWSEEVIDSGARVGDWIECASLSGHGFRVHVFYGLYQGDPDASAATDEAVTFYPIEAIDGLHTVPNARWILPMIMTMISGEETASYFTIVERGTDQENRGRAADQPAIAFPSE